MRRLYNDAGEGANSRFSELYEEAKRRVEVQKEVKNMQDEHCTFRPDTSRTRERNNELLSKDYFNKPRGKSGSVPDGLLYDAKTGQALFKPKICRPPRNPPMDRNPEDVSDKLYRQALLSRERRNAKIMEYKLMEQEQLKSR